jgi:hypothetical protein
MISMCIGTGMGAAGVFERYQSTSETPAPIMVCRWL